MHGCLILNHVLPISPGCTNRTAQRRHYTKKRIHKTNLSLLKVPGTFTYLPLETLEANLSPLKVPGTFIPSPSTLPPDIDNRRSRASSNLCWLPLTCTYGSGHDIHPTL